MLSFMIVWAATTVFRLFASVSQPRCAWTGPYRRQTVEDAQKIENHPVKDRSLRSEKEQRLSVPTQ